MSKILLDGQGLLDATREINAFHYRSINSAEFDALANLIYAIILWDDAYIIYEPFTSVERHVLHYFNNLGTNINLFRRMKLSPETEKRLSRHFFDNIPLEDVTVDPVLGNYGYKALHHDKRKALGYLLVANESGMDYLPAPKRAELLEQINYQSFFHRKDVLDCLDSHLIAFYEQLNKSIGKSSIHYQFPVLLDYMLEKYGSIEDVIKYSIDFKYTPSVVRFRAELDGLNEAFINGNLLEVRNYFESIQGVVDDITRSRNIKKTVDVSISFPPSLSFSIDIPKMRPNQLIFVKKLAKYGITQRKPTMR